LEISSIGWGGGQAVVNTALNQALRITAADDAACGGFSQSPALSTNSRSIRMTAKKNSTSQVELKRLSCGEIGVKFVDRGAEHCLEKLNPALERLYS